MAKKKRLTKRERQLRQFKKELAARQTKKELDNAIEQHLFEKGDLVKVNGNVGVIADYNENLLSNKHSVGVKAFHKVVEEFYGVLQSIDNGVFPEKFVKFMEHVIPAALHNLNEFAQNPENAFFQDLPTSVECVENGGLKVTCRSVYANRGTGQFIVWKEMFDADEWLKLNLDGEESVVSEQATEDIDYWSGSSDQETSGISGIFDELAQQAYAVKEKRSRNLGLYKVHYTGEMLGQFGKQQVWVAPCNIQAVH